MKMVEPSAKRRLRLMHLVYMITSRAKKLPLCKVPGHHVISLLFIAVTRKSLTVGMLIDLLTTDYWLISDFAEK